MCRENTSESVARVRSNGWLVNRLSGSERMNSTSLVGMDVGSRVRGETVRSVTKNGREYLVFPMVPAREMVMNYPENGTRELLPDERLRESVEMWAGVPLVYVHPGANVAGAPPGATANSPSAYTGCVIGKVYHPKMAGGDALRTEGWVDVEKANAIGGIATDVVEQLRAERELAVSAGYATIGDERTGGVHDGDRYDLVQGRIIPDHVAIFPADEFNARCTPEDGCAAPRANYSESVRTNQNDTMSEQSNQTVFVDETERNRAIEAIQSEYPNVSKERIEEEFDNVEILLGARNEGYRGPGCDCKEALCNCLFPNGTEQSRENTVRQSGESVRIPGGVGGASTRGDWERRRDDESKLNMAGVPGPVDRSPSGARDRSGDYPAGGRRAWERRKMNEARPDDGSDDDVPDYPAGTRGDWEARRAAGGGHYPYLDKRKEEKRREELKAKEKREEAARKARHRGEASEGRN